MTAQAIILVWVFGSSIWLCKNNNNNKHVFFLWCGWVSGWSHSSFPLCSFMYAVSHQLPQVHSASCLCFPLGPDLRRQTARGWSPPSNGLSGPAEEQNCAFIIWMKPFYDGWTFTMVLQGCPTTGPSTEFVDSSPGSPSVAAPCLSPCGWSPSLSQRCFARLGLAPDTSASSVQTVRPALSEMPDSLPCGSR